VGIIGSGLGPLVGCCYHGNERFGSVKGGEFLDQLQMINFPRRALHYAVSSVGYKL
jgi:hypothetical protein